MSSDKSLGALVNDAITAGRFKDGFRGREVEIILEKEEFHLKICFPKENPSQRELQIGVNGKFLKEGVGAYFAGLLRDLSGEREVYSLGSASRHSAPDAIRQHSLYDGHRFIKIFEELSVSIAPMRVWLEGENVGKVYFEICKPDIYVNFISQSENPALQSRQMDSLWTAYQLLHPDATLDEAREQLGYTQESLESFTSEREAS